MNARPKTQSQTRLVLEHLRPAILSGRMLPGSKLNIAALAEDIGVSAGAVREGLATLEAESLVQSEPARGYRVSPVSAQELQQLVAARIEVECLCLAEAILHGDLAWEGGVVAAFHRLSRLPERQTERPTLVNPDWALAHAEFHRALVSGCPNLWLLRIHDMLYQQSERYRQLSAPLDAGERNVQTEHKALMDAVLGRDLSLARTLIDAHLQTTARLILDSPQQVWPS